MSYVDTTKKLQLLSFCTGYGGIERGLELAGVSFRTITHVEIEAFAIANLVAKMEEGRMVSAPIWTNVKTLPLEVFRDRVDILTGGYPCQPFSAAGQRKGAEDPRHLWPHILRAIDVIRPRRVFFENVEGHISLGLQEVIESLEIRGYKTTWGIFSAEEVGAPHRRKRVFIMGDSEGWRDRQLSTKWEGRDSFESTSKKLGNSEHDGSFTEWDKQELQGSGKWEKGEVEQFEGSDKLANTMCNRTQSKQIKTRRQEGESNMAYYTSFPSRPGQQQHRWEEPRTVKSELGGAVDGTSSRVDRLRLLGNGVVPQTAALAWITLNERLI